MLVAVETSGLPGREKGLGRQEHHAGAKNVPLASMPGSLGTQDRLPGSHPTAHAVGASCVIQTRSHTRMMGE